MTYSEHFIIIHFTQICAGNSWLFSLQLTVNVNYNKKRKLIHIVWLSSINLLIFQKLFYFSPEVLGCVKSYKVVDGGGGVVLLIILKLFDVLRKIVKWKSYFCWGNLNRQAAKRALQSHLLCTSYFWIDVWLYIKCLQIVYATLG